MLKEFIENSNENDLKLTLEDLEELFKCKTIYNLDIEEDFPENGQNAKIVLVLIKMKDDTLLEEIGNKLNKIRNHFENAEIIIATNSNFKDIKINLLIGNK